MFDGKKESLRILSELKNKIIKEALEPRLAVVSVDPDPSSKLFIKNKAIRANAIGIDLLEYRFKANIEESKILETIDILNRDSLVNGIIVQLPLPKNFDTGKIIESMDPKKDVDGFHSANRQKLSMRQPYFFSPLSLGIFNALKAGSKTLKFKKIIAIANSDIFGATLKSFFKVKGIKIDYLLSNEGNISSKLKRADVIITACGKPNLINRNMLKKGVVLIDAGIKIKKDGVIVGDVDREGIEEKAVFLTPVPGGIGPLTVAYLLSNVYIACKKYGK